MQPLGKVDSEALLMQSAFGTYMQVTCTTGRDSIALVQHDDLRRRRQ
jgi:hypothetical protein